MTKAPMIHFRHQDQYFLFSFMFQFLVRVRGYLRDGDGLKAAHLGPKLLKICVIFHKRLQANHGSFLRSLNSFCLCFHYLSEQRKITFLYVRRREGEAVTSFRHTNSEVIPPRTVFGKGTSLLYSSSNFDNFLTKGSFVTNKRAAATRPTNTNSGITAASASAETAKTCPSNLPSQTRRHRDPFPTSQDLYSPS